MLHFCSSDYKIKHMMACRTKTENQISQKVISRAKHKMLEVPFLKYASLSKTWKKPYSILNRILRSGWYGPLLENRHKNCTPNRCKASSCQLRRKHYCNTWNDSNILCCHPVNPRKIVKLGGTGWPRWSSDFNVDELGLQMQWEIKMVTESTFTEILSCH